MPADDDMPRFSDGQLLQLRRDFDNHVEEEETRWRQLTTAVEDNTKMVTRIAEAVEKQAESTAGIVQVHNDVLAAMRLGAGLRKLLTHVASLGAVGAAIAASAVYVIDKLNS